MKIILANKFYYRRGGDCIYMLNLEKLLKAHGHEVAVFAMRVCHKSMAHPLLCYLLHNPRSIVAYSKKGII